MIPFASGSKKKYGTTKLEIGNSGIKQKRILWHLPSSDKAYSGIDGCDRFIRGRRMKTKAANETARATITYIITERPLVL
jgi:hypothetical protein